MLAIAGGVDARGRSGSIEFWLWADGLTNDMGWTLQLDAGNGYATRLSELGGINHGWQLYHYDMQRDELVNGLKFRFQFRGGTGDPRIDLDQIGVRIVGVASTGGGLAGSTLMVDDGLHQDGNSGDGVYGAQIPAAGAATTMVYYIIAGDSDGAETRTPADAPATVNAYRVYSATADSVGDGLPDWWRAEYFGGDGTTTNDQSCATCDPDEDGFPNQSEEIAGTAPMDPGSSLSIEAIVAAKPFGPVVSWQSATGKNYRIQRSTNLTVDAFTTLVATGIAAAPPMNAYTDTTASGSATFYRIAVE